MDIIKKKGMNGQDTGLIPIQEDLWVILEEEIPDLVMEEAEVEAVGIGAKSGMPDRRGSRDGLGLES